MHRNHFKHHRTIYTRCPQWMILTALIIGFLGTVAAMPAAAGNQGLESGGITYFLTDPQLGVVGAHRSGEQVFFFEAQRNIIIEDEAPVLDVYARILDGNAQTIAVAASGPDLPAGWDIPQKAFTAEQKAAVDLAQPMMGALASAGIEPAFELEHNIITQLVQSIALQGHTAEGATSFSVPAIFGDDEAKMTEIVTETRDYINGLQQELVIDRSDSARLAQALAAMTFRPAGAGWMRNQSRAASPKNAPKKDGRSCPGSIGAVNQSQKHTPQKALWPTGSATCLPICKKSGIPSPLPERSSMPNWISWMLKKHPWWLRP